MAGDTRPFDPGHYDKSRTPQPFGVDFDALRDAMNEAFGKVEAETEERVRKESGQKSSKSGGGRRKKKDADKGDKGGDEGEGEKEEPRLLTDEKNPAEATESAES